MSGRRIFSVDFKKMIVQLYESGTSVTDLTSNYGIASTTIYKWNDLYKKDEDSGVSKADLLAMQARITKLESENDIVKKSINHIRKKVSVKDWQSVIKEAATAHSVRSCFRSLKDT